MSIRIDPLDVSAIREAILRLKDDPALRSTMAANSLARSQLFDVDKRAAGIVEFIQRLCQ